MQCSSTKVSRGHTAEPLEVAMLGRGSMLVMAEDKSQFPTLAPQQYPALRVDWAMLVCVDSTSTALVDLQFQLDVSDVNLHCCGVTTMYASTLAIIIC